MDYIEKTVQKNYVFRGKILTVRCDDALLPCTCSYGLCKLSLCHLMQSPLSPKLCFDLRWMKQSSELSERLSPWL